MLLDHHQICCCMEVYLLEAIGLRLVSVCLKVLRVLSVRSLLTVSGISLGYMADSLSQLCRSNDGLCRWLAL